MVALTCFLLFQSTLSVRRATGPASRRLRNMVEFQSTLSVRRATHINRVSVATNLISIHALREESDGLAVLRLHVPHQISIHALREESDAGLGADGAILRISIHALREESDKIIDLA